MTTDRFPSFKSHRINAGQYLRILKSDCRIRGERFVVSAIDNGSSEAGLGLAVAKRIVPRAVDRNYFKRQIRVVYRLASAQLCGFDIVVRLRRAYSKSAAVGAREELAGLLRAVEQCRES